MEGEALPRPVCSRIFARDSDPFAIFPPADDESHLIPILM